MINEPVQGPPTTPPKPNFLEGTLTRAKILYREVRSKKIFKFMVAILGIVVLIIITGAIFSVFRNKNVSTPSVSPAPEVTSQTQAPEADETEAKLKILRDSVFSLDVYQKKLAPPVFDFKISF